MAVFLVVLDLAPDLLELGLDHARGQGDVVAVSRASSRARLSLKRLASSYCRWMLPRRASFRAARSVRPRRSARVSSILDCLGARTSLTVTPKTPVFPAGPRRIVGREDDVTVRSCPGRRRRAGPRSRGGTDPSPGRSGHRSPSAFKGLAVNLADEIDDHLIAVTRLRRLARPRLVGAVLRC